LFCFFIGRGGLLWFEFRALCLLSRQALHHLSSPPDPLPFLRQVSHYVAQDGLKLKILLPQPPRCWDYRVSHHAQ
jgi:hypothetical protein